MKLVVSASMPIFQLNLKVLLSESTMSVSSTKMDWELPIRLAVQSETKEIFYFFQKKLYLSRDIPLYNLLTSIQQK